MVENIEHLFYTLTIIIFLYHKTYSKNNFFNYNIKNKFFVVVSFLMLILFIVFGNIKKEMYMIELEIVKFLKEHDDWREILHEEPYCLKIAESDDYILLKYRQTSSDFHQKIVRECRGIILNKEYKPVCVPFFKFGNYGEFYADSIDWDSAKVQEKIDGSLIKVWYDKKWHISTNGTIDAFDACIQGKFYNESDGAISYGQLFECACKKQGLDFESLNKDYTYMFELVSPLARVVVAYDTTKIYHIGTRDNTTLEELDVDINIQKPNLYSLHSLEDCLHWAKKLQYNEEGFVVVDKNWHRIKIKSPKYLLAHKLDNNGFMHKDSVLNLIRENDYEELLIYCPEFKPYFDKVLHKISEMEQYIQNIKIQFNLEHIQDQKEFALKVKECRYSSYFFNWKKCPSMTPREWLFGLTNLQIERVLDL